MILYAKHSARTLHLNYLEDHKEFRNSKGIYPLSKANDTIVENWDNLFPDDKQYKWELILKNNPVGNQITFLYDSLATEPFHQSKTIFFDTRLFFWQNKYSGEIDVFLNPISTDTLIEMVITYNSQHYIHGEYFYANIDTIIQKEIDFFECGTASYFNAIDYMEKYPKGNITKHRADEILKKWNLTKQ
ncbi:hypothetical protein [Marinigracilibium pacificum]|uniref:Uncharacterized protein n=1 Tax=Marinigracilibium pacificum TaxID=2729599 RepID=A0A848J2N4_9BACT|nr:hypothetical protein [Marinigracilibium pacificum]NMM50857.1 hypothetical protein [Marinigracilibium pacificum]